MINNNAIKVCFQFVISDSTKRNIEGGMESLYLFFFNVLLPEAPNQIRPLVRIFYRNESPLINQNRTQLIFEFIKK